MDWRAFLRSIRTFLGLWWTTGLAVPLSTILAAAASLTTTDYYDLPIARHISWTLTLFLLAIVSGIAGTLEAYRTLRKWRKRAELGDGLALRAETAELALIETICDELRNVIAILSLFSYGRASLFICKQDHFVLAGRYSPMAQFGRSLGRARYPLGAGILGKAWNYGEAADPELPEPGPVNKPPFRAWLQAQERHGIKTDVASGFAMRSRCYSAIRLEYKRDRLGVVMIESTLPAEKTASSKVGGAPGGSMEALRALDAGSREIGILSRALHQLRHLDDGQLRERVVKYLPDR